MMNNTLINDVNVCYENEVIIMLCDIYFLIGNEE